MLIGRKRDGFKCRLQEVRVGKLVLWNQDFASKQGGLREKCEVETWIDN
jgi:hypothetical protein